MSSNPSLSASLPIPFVFHARSLLRQQLGRRPAKGRTRRHRRRARPSRIDPKTGIANHGTVSVLAPVDGKWQQVKTIRVGLHPSGMVASPRRASSSTSPTPTATRSRSSTPTPTRSSRRSPAGPKAGFRSAAAATPWPSAPTARRSTSPTAPTTASPSSASGPGRRPRSRPQPGREPGSLGLIPTGWYPGAVLVSADGKKLFRRQRQGARLAEPKPRAPEQGQELARSPRLRLDHRRARRRASSRSTPTTVNANNRLAYSLAGLEKPRPDARRCRCPQRHGEPSVFKHVIYVIKENRTYDQVFGDMKEGNGDPKLCMFGEDVTPNHHTLARAVHAVRQLLLQRRAQRRRPPVGQRGLRHRLPGEGLRRLHAQLSLRGQRSARLRLERLPLGQRPGAQEDVPQLRRVRQGDLPPRTRPGPTCTTTTRTARARSRSTVKANVKALEPYTHPAIPGFPSCRRRTSTGPSCSSTS